MFADENEGWVLLYFAGGQGCGSPNGLGPMTSACPTPATFTTSRLTMRRSRLYGLTHFIDFAIEQGWFDPEQDEAFNATLVYGVDKERYPRSAMEAELRAAAPIDRAR